MNDRAVQAVRQWRFSPARRQGAPVDVIVEVSVEFKLQMTFLLLVTLISLLLAAIMSADRLARWPRDERRRSEARVAALAAEIHGAERVAPIGPLTTSSCGRAARVIGRRRPVRDRAAGAIAERAGAAVLAAGALRRRRRRPRSSSCSAADASGTTDAVEPGAGGAVAGRGARRSSCVALGHERDGDRLTVRGVVRNPASGAAVDRLTAVVFLFDRDGGFLTSGRVDRRVVRPCGRAANRIFVVTVPGAARRRAGIVSASGPTTAIVPHVDRREHRRRL